MENIWKGWVIDESLKDVTILSKLKVPDEKISESVTNEINSHLKK